MSTPLSELKWSSKSSLDADISEMDDDWQWSAEEVAFLQTMLVEESMDFLPNH